jgi:hypothetical protein
MQRFASLSKLTLILARTSGSTLRPLVPRAPTPGVRFNSSNIPKQSPAGTKVDKYADHNDAMRDWQAPIVSYEQLKPKTESPDPVRSVLYDHVGFTQPDVIRMTT